MLDNDRTWEDEREKKMKCLWRDFDDDDDDDDEIKKARVLSS